MILEILASVEPIVEAAAEADSEGNIWLGVVAVIVPILIPVVLWLKKLGVKKLEKKLGFEIPDALEEIANSYVLKGISKAENWAESLSEKPSSENKLAEAIKSAIVIAGDNDYVKGIIKAKGEEIVESLLKSDVTTNTLSPKEK